MIEKRNIALCIVLSIVTLGIYGLVWFVWLSNDANNAAKETNGTSGGIALLLTIVTCGIYGLYWAYKQGEKLDKASVDRGLPSDNKGIIYLVLSIFGLGIIAYALMQDSLNKMSDLDVGATY